MDHSTGTTYSFSNTRYILKIAKRFNNRWNFPNYIGNIDGKNIIIKCPPNSGSRYFNYKHYHSIVFQAAVDPNLKFLTVDVRAYGKQKMMISGTHVCIRAWKHKV
jgi:hypothetical protein